MKVSLKWLDKYIDTKKLDIKKLVSDLTFRSVEVEDVFNMAENLSGFVVGKIKEVEKHQKADKLKVLKVDIGKEELQIVTAALNVEKGQLVPVATIGTKLSSGDIISKVSLRGVDSFGMLCGKEELGLGKDEKELYIHILPGDCRVGEPISKALGLDDVVIDLAIPANRPDLMGHEYIAREIAVLENIDLKEQKDFKLPKEEGKLELEITNQDFKLCKRFCALVISGVEIKESPSWLKSRLISVGIRPINNIVDLTNYLMYDTAHVFHAFDYDKISGRSMNIRSAKNRESLVVLDGEKVELGEGMLIIEDKSKIIDLPGIKGGANSGISETTNKIVFITAVDDAFMVRKTSRLIGIRTDAVGVVEKGIDPETALSALTKGFNILKDLSPGIELQKIIDLYKKPSKISPVVIRLAQLNKLLGASFEKEFVLDVFEKLKIEVKKERKDSFEVLGPSFRKDLAIEEDFVEEVARIYGLNNLPSTPILARLEKVDFDKNLRLQQKAKDVLLGLGFYEVYNYSFISPKMAESVYLQPEAHLAIKNPLSVDQSLMRQELISSLLSNTRENLKNFDDLKIFELAKVYFPATKTSETSEGYKLNALVACKGKKSQLFYQIKAQLETLLSEFGINRLELRALDKENFAVCPYYRIYDFERAADVFVEGKLIGTIGEVSRETLSSFDIEAQAAIFDLSFSSLVALSNFKKIYKSLPRFPGVVFDLAVVANENIKWQEIRELVKKTGGEIVKSIDLFDVYQGEKIGKGKKSLAFKIVYRDKLKTLKLEEAQEAHGKIISALAEELGVGIRK